MISINLWKKISSLLSYFCIIFNIICLRHFILAPQACELREYHHRNTLEKVGYAADFLVPATLIPAVAGIFSDKIVLASLSVNTAATVTSVIGGICMTPNSLDRIMLKAGTTVALFGATMASLHHYTTLNTYGEMMPIINGTIPLTPLETMPMTVGYITNIGFSCCASAIVLAKFTWYMYQRCRLRCQRKPNTPEEGYLVVPVTARQLQEINSSIQ